MEDNNPKELKCICNVVCPVNHENDKFKRIKAELLRKRGQYNDPDFPAVNSSIGSDGYIRQHIGNFHIQWRRPREITNNPKFFVEGPTRFDVVQGAVGDCWFLASIAVLTSNDKILHRVLPKNQSFTDNYAGIFYFRFWQYGKWVTVIVDDRLPTYNNGKTLLFTKSSQSNEFWSALIEKAYAKLHGSYEAISGGMIGDAVEDLTGGLSEMVTVKPNEESQLFQVMLQAHKRGALIGCSVYPNSGEHLGIYGGHAYSITSVRNIELGLPQGMLKKRMVRVRNQWGNKLEWTGSWSDEDPIWKKVSKEVKEKLNLRNSDDGEYWMDVKDFCKYFSSVEITQLNLASERDPITEKKWEITEFHGSWIPGVTAGGSPMYHDTFHTNPQYRLILNELDDVIDDDENDGNHKCTVIVSIMQKNRRQEFANQNLTIGFSIFQVSDAENTLSVFDKSFFAKNGYGRVGQSHYRQFRTSTHRFQLPPGNYCVVPTTLIQGEKGEYLLRIFTEKHHKADE